LTLAPCILLGNVDHQPHHRRISSAPAAPDSRPASLVLEGIMCQSLLPRIDGKGRAMIMEI